MPTIVLRLFFILIGIAYASSGDASDTSPVTLTLNDSGSSVVLRLGQILNVTLYGNGSTGYVWEVISGSESILQQGETHFVIDSTCQPEWGGCGGMYTYTFKATAPGQAPLKLIYHRLWETGVAPLRTFEVTVTAGAEIAVPTLTYWGMVLFALFAGLGSAHYLMRRKIPHLVPYK